jgi:hypothetical protein
MSRRLSDHRWSKTTVACIPDHRIQDGGRDASALRGSPYGEWRSHEGAKGAIETPLLRKLAPPLVGQREVHAGPTALEDTLGRERRKLAAADREPQPVSRHRIDEACGVARQKQAVARPAGRVHRERAEHDRRTREASVSKPIAKDRVGRQRAPKGRFGVSEICVTSAGRLDKAHVEEATRNRRDANVPAPPDVHLANGRSIPGLYEVGTDGPPARLCGMARQAQTECQRGSPAVGRDHRGGAKRSRAAVRAGPNARHDAALPVIGEQRLAYCDARLEQRARRDGFLQQRPVQITPAHRSTGQATWIAAFNGDATVARLSGDQHALDTSAETLDPRETETAEHGERAGVERVAAQLVAGKRRAIEDAHASASTREHGARHRPSGARSDDENVIHDG